MHKRFLSTTVLNDCSSVQSGKQLPSPRFARISNPAWLCLRHCLSFRQKQALLLVVSLVMAGFFIALIPMARASSGTHQARVSGGKAKETRKLYKQQCAKCHGADGAGETTQGKVLGATDFRDSEWQERIDDQRLVNSIKHGRGQMPPFDKKLSRDQITSLLAYVRAFKK